MPPNRISLRRRLKVVWDALVRGRIEYSIPVNVNIHMGEYGALCPQDLVGIEESVHMGIVDALREYDRDEERSSSADGRDS